MSLESAISERASNLPRRIIFVSPSKTLDMSRSILSPTASQPLPSPLLIVFTSFDVDLNSWNGKSTGKGALSLWTRNMVTQKIVSYNSSFYHGPALKAGAGVTGGQASQFAAAHGYRVVTGDSPTVGVAGGFTQGGGHSQLSGVYGLGADNVLEWEVVTAEGIHLVATPTKNSDLYWALSGGGGGTYGVVVSMTTRLFDDSCVSSATLAFDVDSTGGVEEFWTAVGVFHDELQHIVDSDGVVAALLLTNASLTVFSITAPGHTADSLSKLLQPMKSALINSCTAGLTEESLALTWNEGSGFHDLYTKTLMPLMDNVTESPVMGGRMVLRNNMASNKSDVLEAFRAATDGGRFYLASTALNTAGPALVARPVAANAVQPEWRDAFLSINIISSTWDWNQNWGEAAVRQADMIDRVLPAMEAATPGSAVYLNEGNWEQPDWQHAFYGANYNRLLKIKNKYDPHGLFYALTAVGSEAWIEDAKGRLCRN